MSKTRLILSFAVGLEILMLPLSMLAQSMSDAPGVTVNLNGSTVLHRTAVTYPAAAQRRGVQGILTVEVRLDSTGSVSDAQVLSGPDELRNATLQSVLQWHFTHDAAGTTRQVQIAFELPKPTAATAEVDGRRTDTGVVQGVLGGIVTAPPPPGATRQMVFTSPVIAQTLQGRIKSIRVVGLPESAGAELLATLPVHEGDELNAETIQRVSQAAKAYDEHLTVQWSGITDVSLAITAPGIRPAVQTLANTAGAMQVDSDVESALIVRKVAPVYPPLAKSARVAGAVRLSAVIGRDGTVQELHSLDGPALLIQAAMDAVKQWIYKPTLLNGNPVPVQTTIIINFTLAE